MNKIESKIKIFSIFFTILFIGFFSSCTLEGESNYTPEILFLNNPKLQNGDSLSFYYTDEGGVFRLDTIQVGDTVKLNLYMHGFANNLLAFYIKDNTESALKLVLPEKNSMDSIFLPTSDYADGKFLMDGKSTTLFFPLKYIALKPASKPKIQFTIVSDAKFKDLWGSNTATVTLITPIVDHKE